MTAHLSPAEHLEAVQRSFDGAVDPRTAEVVRAAVAHLHAFVEEVGLTSEEWLEGIRFLTAVGAMCDDVRQEFILLSDTLGVSMLVEMLNHRGGEGATEPTVLGPFHVEGAPARAFGESIVTGGVPGSGARGDPMVLRGTVRDTDGRPVAGATLDVWQTGADGRYDVQVPERDGLDLRGVFTTDDEGGYEIRTIRPVDYTIPDDGPVGQMLRATGRQPWRPAHVHVVASAPGYRTVTTHVFDAASRHLDSDAVFGVRPSLVTDMGGGEAEFDIVLDHA
jgi:hydroxyquinol 1,2-dioxygenase